MPTYKSNGPFMISGVKEVHEKFRLTDHAVQTLVRDVIHEATGLERDTRVNDKGELVQETEQYGGSHSWWDTKPLRKATEADRQAVAVLAAVNKYFADRRYPGKA